MVLVNLWSVFSVCMRVLDIWNVSSLCSILATDGFMFIHIQFLAVYTLCRVHYKVWTISNNTKRKVVRKKYCWCAMPAMASCWLHLFHLDSSSPYFYVLLVPAPMQIKPFKSTFILNNWKEKTSLLFITINTVLRLQAKQYAVQSPTLKW